MKRDITKQLNHWSMAAKRKPLVVLGARQVGKTYTLREFGHNRYQKVHEINFQSTPSAHSVFAADLDAARMVRDLELVLGTTIDTRGDEALFFDEIQDCPRALTALKYFCEQLPSLPVMTAGSLLGIYLVPTPFPVGKVDIVYMDPMSFGEVLQAQQKSKLFEAFTAAVESPQSLSPVAHEQLWDAFKNYLCTGGLPEVVSTWIDHGSDRSLTALSAARQLLQLLIASYTADIAKHAGKVNAMHIERVWRNVPQQLALAQDASTNRYKFKNVITGVNAYRDLAGPIDWLVRAHMVHKIAICHSADSPIAAFTKENIFKLYMFDTGILGALLNLQPSLIQDFDFGTYKGYLAENFVAAELIATRPHRAGEPSLHAWCQGQAEIEFLVESSLGAIPIEVKSGQRIRAQSLRSFNDRYKPAVSIILSARRPSETIDGSTRHINLPLYLASRIWHTGQAVRGGIFE